MAPRNSIPNSWCLNRFPLIAADTTKKIDKRKKKYIYIYRQALPCHTKTVSVEHTTIFMLHIYTRKATRGFVDDLLVLESRHAKKNIP